MYDPKDFYAGREFKLKDNLGAQICKIVNFDVHTETIYYAYLSSYYLSSVKIKEFLNYCEFIDNTLPVGNNPIMPNIPMHDPNGIFNRRGYSTHSSINNQTKYPTVISGSTAPTDVAITKDQFSGLDAWLPGYEGINLLKPVVCECGCDSIGISKHSSYCPKYIKE